MSTTNPTASPQLQPQRPKLEILMEQLVSVMTELQSTSVSYQRLKSITKASRLPDFNPAECNIGMQIVIGGVAIAIPAPQDAAGYSELLEDAQAACGDRVVKLWGEAKRITDEAAEVCAAASQATQ